MAVVAAGSSGTKKAERGSANCTHGSSVCSKGGYHGDHLLSFAPIHVVAYLRLSRFRDNTLEARRDDVGLAHDEASIS